MRRSHLLIFLLAAGCGRASPAFDGDASLADSSPMDGFRPDADIDDFSLVYAHSGTTLYRLDTTSLEPVLVADFSDTGTQSMTDLAIDKDDRMFGITLDRIYSIDPDTAATTLVVDFADGVPNLTSLSFVPLDLSEPDGVERLVAAADDGTAYEIDQVTGSATAIGAYGSAAGGTIASSGDLVAVRDYGILATVTIGLPFSNPDHLARVDPVTWEAIPLGIGTGYDRIFGIGFWRGKVYGFVDLGAGVGGAILELDPNTGEAQIVNKGSIRWYGAGVTTDAPIVD